MLYKGNYLIIVYYYNTELIINRNLTIGIDKIYGHV